MAAKQHNTPHPSAYILPAARYNAATAELLISRLEGLDHGLSALLRVYRATRADGSEKCSGDENQRWAALEWAMTALRVEMEEVIRETDALGRDGWGLAARVTT